MIPDLLEAIAKDIADKTDVKTIVTLNANEINKPIAEGEESLPLVQVVPSVVTPFADQRFYEAHHANGSITREAYDMDHIPEQVQVLSVVAGKDATEVEDVAFSIRSAYNGSVNTDSILYPLENDGSYVIARYAVKRVRSQVQKMGHRSTTIIEPAESVKVPAPYPVDDLRASLSDRGAISRLLATYSYYMSILESDIPNILANDYAKLFEKPENAYLNKIKDAKKGVSNILHKTSWEGILETAGVLDAPVVQPNNDKNVRALIKDFQAGVLSREAFEAHFDAVLPVMPDLYERAMKRESLNDVTTCAQSKLTEIQRRADVIANSLGLEKNPEGNKHYQPRSFAAAIEYMQTLGSSTDEAISMYDISQAYKKNAAERKAEDEGRRSAITGAIISGAIAGIGSALTSEKSTASNSTTNNSTIKIYRGDSTMATHVAYTIKGDKVYRGDSTMATHVAYTIKGDKVYRGDSTMATHVAYTIK